jgi:hypothetical protein
MPREFPTEAARDLIGVLRAMYAAEKERPFPGAMRLRRIERLGQELQRALALSEQHDAGTAPYDRALSLAEGVVLRIGDLVDVTHPIEPVLLAAGRRVLGQGRIPTLAEQRRASGRKRG